MPTTQLEPIDEETYFGIRDGVAQHIFYVEEEVDLTAPGEETFAPLAAELLTFFQAHLAVPEGMVSPLIAAVAGVLLAESARGLDGDGWFGEEQSNAVADRIYRLVTRVLGYPTPLTLDDLVEAAQAGFEAGQLTAALRGDAASPWARIIVDEMAAAFDDEADDATNHQNAVNALLALAGDLRRVLAAVEGAAPGPRA
jgi:hypothetical protein